MNSDIEENDDIAQPEETEEKGGFKFRYVFIIIIILLLLLAIVSHSSTDIRILEGGQDGALKNWIGPAGANFARISFYLFGVATYPIILLLMLCSFRSFLPYPTNRRGYVGSIIALVIGITILLAMCPEKFIWLTNYLGIGSENSSHLSALSGGVIGQKLAAPEMSVQPGIITSYIGAIGTFIVGMVFLLSGGFFIWLSDWHKIFVSMKDENLKKSELEDSIETLRERRERERLSKYDSFRVKKEEEEKKDSVSHDKVPEEHEQKKAAVVPEPKKKPQKKAKEPITAYTLPPVTLLDKGKEIHGEDQSFIDASKNVLQATLDSFGIQGRVVGEISGPRVTRYEIALDPGVKVERITGISNNIAKDLQAESIRILAPIPGKNTVGIEIPNSKVSFITIRSVMEAMEWTNSNHEIPIILGRDVAGNAIVMDLARAPHLLIAGATGSGKSVCMHSLIMSLLYKFSPTDLSLIMVDPKMVEFSNYTSIPHLITPVVNDARKVPVALHWGVVEMEKRYKIFSKAKARKLSEFNKRERTAEPILDDDGQPLPDKLPVLVIIIDELADIMMNEAKGTVENSIARIAQKGRAAGIHIVIATQTPRKQIITGVIKANLPTRIAFQVSSIVDSGVILDRKGAEKLLGRGDMLFIPPGSSNMERIQGSMVSDKEIEKVVKFIADQGVPSRIDETILSGSVEMALEPGLPGIGEEDIGGEGDLSEEELIRKAIEVVVTDRKASTSYIQRRLGVGYNKAANLIEILEDRGIVGPPMGASAKREILVVSNDLPSIMNSNPDSEE